MICFTKVPFCSVPGSSCDFVSPPPKTGKILFSLQKKSFGILCEEMVLGRLVRLFPSRFLLRPVSGHFQLTSKYVCWRPPLVRPGIQTPSLSLDIWTAVYTLRLYLPPLHALPLGSQPFFFLFWLGINFGQIIEREREREGGGKLN